MERGLLYQNLTLLEDHGLGTSIRCPYCMEKHASKIGGYAGEIAAGHEGDEKVMFDLAEKAQDWFKRIQPLKDKPVEADFNLIGTEARDWRRKVQGAHSHGHENVDIVCSGPNCETRMSHSHEKEEKEELELA